MRVYELAKKLGMESRQLIPELVRMGIEVTSHSNALDEDTAQRALQALQRDGAGGRTQAATLPVKEKGSLHKKRVGAASARAKAVVEEELPKPQKKRILIKRKKTEAEDASVESGIEESVTAPLGAKDEQMDSAVLEAESVAGKVESEQEAPLPVEPLSPKEPLKTAEAPVLESAVEPLGGGIGHQASTSPQANLREIGETVTESPKKKELGQPDADLLEEKVKKPKKPGRLRDEDLFAARYEDAARWQDLRPLPTLRREERMRHHQPTAVTEITKPRKKVIKLQPGITVKEFAELLGQRPTDIMKKLMDVGMLLTLNQPMNLDAGALIAAEYGLNVEVVAEKEGEALLEDVLQEKKAEQLVPRAPVVTVMGHVDHGKTSLLDAIRQTQVTSREAGGITQHIGAYSVSLGEKRITFLDTPGHEAFTAMRARGAQVTDIVVLVVAADDGVMPQTVEAIHHAQAANVPIIVAINKIDKPGANPDRVKQGLAEHGLIPESWGGQTIYVEVSAKQQLGIEQLLEMILLQAEVMELKADVAGPGTGVVLEAKLDRGRGPVATVLVQSGKVKIGDAFVVGTTSGRVRALVSDSGARVKEAGPSMPVEVVGLLGVPVAGDRFLVVKDERVAREVATDRQRRQREAELKTAAPERTLEGLLAQGADVKELSLLVKGDVQGSVEALCEAIRKLSTDRVKLRVLHSGVGGITESDVQLAVASRAMIIGFHVRPEPKAAALAEREGVEIRLHTVIYNVINDLRAAAEGLLAPTLKERVLGRAEVRQLFTVPRVGTVAGCYVLEGHIARAAAGVRVIRDHVQVYEGKLGSLRRFKDDVREVQQGYECGISIEHFNDLKIGDIIEAYVHDEEAAKL